MALVCGTGFGNFPKPGDPDNNSVLSAKAMFGGIMVTWTYPELNPHAVAHTRLYRSTNPDPATRVRQRIVNGDYWFDTFEGLTPLTYYYWIEIVSVHGTVGELIGPASATVEPTTAQMIEMLSGEIKESLLDQQLRAKITHIQALEDGLNTEIQNRIQEMELVGDLIDRMQLDLERVDTAILQETVQRTTAYSAVVNQIDLILATSNDNTAAIAQEAQTRADQDEALALQISTVATKADDNSAAILQETQARSTQYSALASQYDALSATVADNTAQINQEQQARADGDSALAQQITNLATVVDDNAALISSETTARVDGDAALAQDISLLAVSVGENGAAIQTEQQARIDGDDALASQITTLQSTVGDNTALIQTVQQVTNGVAAQYMVKTDVNGYVTGFGLYNDGSSSQFLVRADRFAVGNPGDDEVFPFIINNGIAYLDEVRVKGAQIDELYASQLLGGTITAVVELKAAAITGGSININNRFTVSSTGVVTIRNATTGSRLEIHNDVIKVFERVGSVDRLRVKLGNLNA